MKKTCVIALLSALACVASAEDFTLNTVYTGNDNNAIHGFTLNLGSAAFGSVTDLPDTVTLNGFTMQGTTSTSGVGVTFGFVVLGDFGDNNVVGISTGVDTSAQNANTSFSFVAADGSSPLTLGSTSTYRFIVVDQAVLDLITSDTTKSYVYNGVGKNPVESTTEGDVVTISHGLTAPGIRGYYATDAATDSAVITAANLSSLFTDSGRYFSPILSDISVSTPAVPEPATATLSLLALAGLAARRRRK